MGSPAPPLAGVGTPPFFGPKDCTSKEGAEAWVYMQCIVSNY